MTWWEFVTALVGKREFDQTKCGKCDTAFADNYQITGVPHGMPGGIGTMLGNVAPVLCERCYARLLIYISEWFQTR